MTCIGLARDNRTTARFHADGIPVCAPADAS